MIEIAAAFQSTPSGGKATRANTEDYVGNKRFNPRLPGGRRRPAAHALRDVQRFNPRLPGGRRHEVARHLDFPRAVSIHAFRGEGDPREGGVEATLGIVSIHAFRGEGDAAISRALVSIVSFNPRLPGGRRPQRVTNHVIAPAFQSTPSGGKATPHGPVSERWVDVSIHAFRGEGDQTLQRRHLRPRGFNPRLPGGRRPDAR